MSGIIYHILLSNKTVNLDIIIWLIIQP